MPKDNEMSRVKKRQSKNNKRKNQSKKSNKRPLWKKILFVFVLLFALIILGGAGLFFYYASDAPEVTEEDLLGTFPSLVVDSNGEEFYSFGGQNRVFAEAEEIPEVLEQAVLAIEDQRFYSHIGVDPIRIGGAVVSNITDGFGAAGGSTITQQLIKLSVFSTKAEDQTLERKAQEAWLAVQLERELSKEQILTLYINKVYMSDNVYGMGTASEYYYDKHISELELHEAALLAGLPQAPNAYNPYTNPEQAKKRRDIVLYMMADFEAITSEQAQEAMQIPIEEGLTDHSGEENNNLVFDAFIKEVRNEVVEKTGLDPYTAGLTIHTTIDIDAQQHLFDLVNTDEYIEFPDEELQTAATMVDVETGQVRAMIGGRHQEGQLALNRATESAQPAGSVVKPLTTYGPAIEHLQYSTYHQIVDEPYTYSDGTPLSNWDNSHKGQISMREALVDSRNIPTYKLFEEVGKDNAQDFLDKIGIEELNANADVDYLTDQNAINGDLTPLQASASFAAFANGGSYTEPYTVTKVVMQDGQEIDLTPETHRAMEDYTAYMVTDMLKDVIDYYGSTLTIPGLPHAGKTGTTNYTAEQHQEYNIPSSGVPDSWFAGYSSNYSIAVWVGYDHQLEEGNWLSFDEGTRQLPRHIYRELMSYVSESVENSDWSMPSSVVEVPVEDGSMPAALPGPNTPASQIVTELFVKGTEPSEQSTEFGEELAAPTGLSAAYNEEADQIEISWDAYELTGEETPVYQLTVGGESFTTEETSYVYPSPSPGETAITLSVQAYGQTSPAVTTTVRIGEEPEEEPEEEDTSADTSEDTADTADTTDTSEPDTADEDTTEDTSEPSTTDTTEEEPSGEEGNGEDTTDTSQEEDPAEDTSSSAIDPEDTSARDSSRSENSDSGESNVDSRRSTNQSSATGR